MTGGAGAHQSIVELCGSEEEVNWIRSRLASSGLTCALIDTALVGRSDRVAGSGRAILVMPSRVADAAAVRRSRRHTPIIVLSDDPDARIDALRSFADDAVHSAVAPAELAARIGAVIRRAEHATPASRKHAPAQGRSVYVDPSNLSVVVDARHIRLTPRQIELVSLLESRNPTNPLSLERIRQIISDKKVYKLSKETIRVHISMVNKKLTEAAVANVRICRNVQGYYMQSA